MTFGARLREMMDERGPLCVGIDPHPGLLAAWGLGDDPVGLERCALGVVEALAGQVAVLKPQSAFFERHGSAGIAVLERAVSAARSAGALVLLDVKRGDIGSTMQAYADAYVDPSSPLACDAVTASPYLGFGSLAPLIDTARRHDAGVFVLALTSNQEGPEVQHARTSQGTTVAASVLAKVRALNQGAAPMGSVGAVVGATIGETGEDLAVGGPLLAPGVGEQGGTPADIRRVFARCLGYVLPSTSRDVLLAGPDPGRLSARARMVADDMVTMVS
ncbi:MAG: orotidine-5'-phosphate decarboxylase [Actinomycetota bacterium]|jgi:orotidine-5'-phosphate decarboxylase|nr:orotidine-5'-phosphate decarboxylase [Actinomycetota bacterium]